jgi:hypothetical protein
MLCASESCNRSRDYRSPSLTFLQCDLVQLAKRSPSASGEQGILRAAICSASSENIGQTGGFFSRGRGKRLSVSGWICRRAYYELEALLARNGRGGKWAPYLRSMGISLSTGDRYVQRRTLSLSPENLLTGEVPAPPTDINNLVAKLRPKLTRF